jgi:hypothetical protein
VTAHDPHTGRGSLDVVAWRARQLVRHGFDVALAQRLAADDRADLHAIIELVERGCAPDLAARILAPLPRDGRPA